MSSFLRELFFRRIRRGRCGDAIITSLSQRQPGAKRAPPSGFSREAPTAALKMLEYALACPCAFYLAFEPSWLNRIA
mgnify:CR=1 FL=1